MTVGTIAAPWLLPLLSAASDIMRLAAVHPSHFQLLFIFTSVLILSCSCQALCEYFTLFSDFRKLNKHSIYYLVMMWLYRNWILLESRLVVNQLDGQPFCHVVFVFFGFWTVGCGEKNIFISSRTLENCTDNIFWHYKDHMINQIIIRIIHNENTPATLVSFSVLAWRHGNLTLQLL